VSCAGTIEHYQFMAVTRLALAIHDPAPSIWRRACPRRDHDLEDNMSDKQVKVRVSGRWRVVHDGKPYVKGETVTVPESVAQEWERSGYVERVTGN
jgi:hypothetical protein